MNSLSLRFGFHRFWNHFYFPKFFLNKSFPLPSSSFLLQDLFIKKIFDGFFPSHHLHIQKYRDFIIIYLTFDHFLFFDFFKLFQLKRLFFNLFKSKIFFFTFYSFPIHDAPLLLSFFLSDHKDKLDHLKKLWLNGQILGIKIKLKGRFKKSTRTQYDIFQFGQIPNSPSSNLHVQLFYSSSQLFHSLGTSSLHIFIYYP